MVRRAVLGGQVMSHGWFVLLMAVTVIAVVAFFAWAVRFMARTVGGWLTAGICATALACITAIIALADGGGTP